MTTDITERTETDSLEHLDFTPVCDFKVTLMILRWLPWVGIKCRRCAEWVGNTPCCGAQWLSCNPHRWDSGFFGCPLCSRISRNLVGWRRL